MNKKIIIFSTFIISLYAIEFENDMSLFLNDPLMPESFYSLENITSPFNELYRDNLSPLLDQNDIFNFSISSYLDKTSPSIPTQTESFPSNSSPSTELTNTEKLAVKLVNDHINEHTINQLNKSYIKKRIINPSSAKKKKTYICESCGYRTKNEKCLIAHNQSKKHQNNTGQSKYWDQYTYKCPTCNYGTNRKNNYKRHEKAKEHLIKISQPLLSWEQHKYLCYTCKYGANHKNNYDQHEKTKGHLIKTGQSMLSWEQHKYLCHTCKYGTNHKSSYDQHEKAKEHLIKTSQPLLSWEQHKYLCHTCKYGTDLMGNFNQHQATKQHKAHLESI